MKVFNCPNCHVVPEITPSMIKCPKCGKASKGKDLTDTVQKWNNGECCTETKVKVVAEEVEKPEKEPVEEVDTVENVDKTAKKSKKSAKRSK